MRYHRHESVFQSKLRVSDGQFWGLDALGSDGSYLKTNRPLIMYSGTPSFDLQSPPLGLFEYHPGPQPAGASSGGFPPYSGQNGSA